jgi:hypothetical protein
MQASMVRESETLWNAHTASARTIANIVASPTMSVDRAGRLEAMASATKLTPKERPTATPAS